MVTAPDGAEQAALTDEDVVILDGADASTETQQPATTPNRQRFADLEEGDEGYGAKVQKRISQTLSQRNAARAELDRERAARQALEREMSDLRRTALDATEAAVSRDLGDAKARYQRAFAEADGEGATAASADMAELSARRLELQQSRQRVDATKPAQQQTRAAVSAESQAYIDANPWFEGDPLARNAAINAHVAATRRGVKIDTPEYFDSITKAVRAQHPEHFDEEVEVEPPVSRPAAPVAPVAAAHRTAPGTPATAANRLPQLTREEADFARQSGIPLAKYAAEKLKLSLLEKK